MKFQAIALRSLSIVIYLFLSGALAQDTDSDDLLLLIPAIVSNLAPLGSPPPPTGLDKVEELNGRFLFSRASSTPGVELKEYYRFDQSTASSTSDPTIFTIQGDGSLFPEYLTDYCDGGMEASYSVIEETYLVVCDWGFPDTDIGSVYAFDTVENSFSIERFAFTPSNGQLTSNVATPATGTKLSDVFKLESKEQTRSDVVKWENRIAKKENRLGENSLSEIPSLTSIKSRQFSIVQNQLNAIYNLNERS